MGVKVRWNNNNTNEKLSRSSAKKGKYTNEKLKKWYQIEKTKEENTKCLLQLCVVKRFEVFWIYSQPTATIILRSLLAWLTMKTGVSLLSIIKNRTGVASSAHTLKLCRNVHEHESQTTESANTQTHPYTRTRTHMHTGFMMFLVLFFVMEFMVVACCLPMNHNIYVEWMCNAYIYPNVPTSHLSLCACVLRTVFEWLYTTNAMSERMSFSHTFVPLIRTSKLLGV